MSVQLFRPENITVNLPMLPTEGPRTYSLPNRHYDANPGETVEQLLARVASDHPDVTSIVLVALKATEADTVRMESGTPQEAHYEMFRVVEAAASKFPDRDAAIARVLEVAAHMQFVESCDIPDDMPTTWTNNDYRRGMRKADRTPSGHHRQHAARPFLTNRPRPAALPPEQGCYFILPARGRVRGPRRSPSAAGASARSGRNPDLL